MAGRGRQRWWALAALSLAVLAVGLDATVLSVALPTLATALGAAESDLQWFSSGYLLVLAAAMLPAGLLGDRYGRKRVLLAGLTGRLVSGRAANLLSAPVGPILGGWLLTRYWWGWVFLINLPVVLIGLLAVVALVPESRASSALDWTSSASSLRPPGSRHDPLLGITVASLISRWSSSCWKWTT